MEIGFIIVQPELIFVVMAIGRCLIVDEDISLGIGEIIAEVIIGILDVGGNRLCFLC
jgi:hypothetical protein